MNLKLSAGLWSSKNSLLNKLLLGHSKYLLLDTSVKEKGFFLFVPFTLGLILWPLMLNL